MDGDGPRVADVSHEAERQPFIRVHDGNEAGAGMSGIRHVQTALGNVNLARKVDEI